MRNFKELWTIEITQLTQSEIDEYVSQWEDRGFILWEIEKCIGIVSSTWL